MTSKLAKLGNKVKDVTTGVNGFAVQYVEMFNGTVQMCVQPVHDDDTVCSATEAALPALNIDIQLLDVMDKGIVDRVVQPEPEVIALGDEVEDIITGMRGIALNRFTFINGCVYYNYQPKPTQKQVEEGKVSAPLFVSGKMLKKVGAGLSETAAAAAAEPVAKRPGGPSTRAMRPLGVTRI